MENLGVHQRPPLVANYVVRGGGHPVRRFGALMGADIDADEVWRFFGPPGLRPQGVTFARSR